jgi:protein SCO1/2
MTVQKQAATVNPETRKSKQPASNSPALPAWILWGRWIAPLVLLLILGGVAYGRFHPTARELKGGAIIAGRQPAPDFVLTDQNGESVQLSSFRGKPVALTFIYTNCADVCPLIAWNMHLAYQSLGSDAKNVSLLAVSVDPEHDTQAQLKAFSDQRQLTNEWHFMTGIRPVLEQVWRSYHIDAIPVDSGGQPLPQGTDLSSATPEQIEHASPTFLLDKGGNVRMMLPIDFTPDTLEYNLRVLLGDG